MCGLQVRGWATAWGGSLCPTVVSLLVFAGRSTDAGVRAFFFGGIAQSSESLHSVSSRDNSL